MFRSGGRHGLIRERHGLGEDIMNHIISAAAAALLVIAAGVANGQDSDHPSSKVSYADLNLSSVRGRATLDARISRAVNIVCGQRPAPVELERKAAYDRCRTAAQADAFQHLAEVTRGEQFTQAAVSVGQGRR